MKLKLDYLKNFSAWLLPHTCILCGYHALDYRDLCHACLSELPFMLHACIRCAKPLFHVKQNTTCGYCLNQAPIYDRTYALFLYEPPITQIIMNLKFGQALINARMMGELLSDKIVHAWYHEQSLPEAIIPMPLHPKRMKQRGYNQAVEIARPIAKILKLPLETSRCQRIINTSAQATLTALARKENVKNAFLMTEKLPYQHVAVIDDVITTGHTMTEFCRTLKHSGVNVIDVWCCARPAF